MNELFTILKALQDPNHEKMLATIVHVEGSSYRKEGAMMLYIEGNKQIGLLSGGCLEADLAERSIGIIQGNDSHTVEYDLSVEDDLSWGQGSGCNGKISVLLERIDDKLKRHFIIVKNYLDQGIPVLHVKKLSGKGNVIDYTFITENQNVFGEWTNENPNQLIQVFSNCKNGIYDLENERYFIQVFNPKPRIIIFGAGPDVRPLSAFAAKAGFTVIITDWRPALCHKTYFPDADDIIIDDPSSLLYYFSFQTNDSVIIMTHHFQKDREILKTLLQNRLQYLGILGPRKRTYQLLEGKEIPTWLHSPVGLPIGAIGPEEIAISILADVIKTVRKEDNHDFWNLPSSWSKQKNGMS
ncbi:XdhC family protein [Anaerobacillus sp. MEB173]|uniref:XdhC family protein n=1 Tax=Anaerobacillus sp. MEB173 TaxID=3383345 RepID=UPI003F8E0189